MAAAAANLALARWLPGRRHVPLRATAAPSAASGRSRRPQNVDGEFFVDQRCIDCDTCRWMAPEVFRRVDGKAAVTAQPALKEQRIKALQALISCPTASIHTEKPPAEILEVQKMFPLPVDESAIPGVYHCGYHGEKSFGGTSYLITHPQGNILVDSPRFSERLASRIDMLGGVKIMFLTHKDDVGDHRRWAERMKCKRIFHSADVEDKTSDVEIKLEGEGPWRVAGDVDDFELIHTPGHTEGSVCLYYKPLRVLFSGDHVYKAQNESEDLEISLVYNQQSVSLQLDNVKKLIDLDFEWLLPGHGRRIRFRSAEHKKAAIEGLLSRYAHLHN